MVCHHAKRRRIVNLVSVHLLVVNVSVRFHGGCQRYTSYSAICTVAGYLEAHPSISSSALDFPSTRVAQQLLASNLLDRLQLNAQNSSLKSEKQL